MIYKFLKIFIKYWNSIICFLKMKMNLNTIKIYKKKYLFKISKNNKEIICNIPENIYFYLKLLKINEPFFYNIKFDEKLKIIKNKDDNISFKSIQNNKYKDYSLSLFFPSGTNLNLKNKKIMINGEGIGYGCFLLIIKSMFNITSIEPILANNKLYPDNYICGFILRGDCYKYILFISSNENQNYKGSERVKGGIFTVLRFVNNELEDVWGIDKDKKIIQY